MLNDILTQQHLTTILAAAALLLALAQGVKVRFLSHCHFGVLAPAALRWRLRLLSLIRRRCAIVALDIRKMHDMNEIFGYSTMNAMVADLVRIRLRPGRRHDLIGQYGGDEFVIVTEVGAGELVIARLIARMAEISERMPYGQREALAARTGGLVDGLRAAIVLVPETHDASGAAIQAINVAGRIKVGVVTDSRSTSGRAGTRIVVLGALG